jgi:hypothetical protein
MFGLGEVLLGEGDYPQAENLLSQVVAISQRVNGPRHLNTLYDRNQRGQAYVENGKVAQGIALLEKTLANSRAIPGAESPDTLRLEVSLGWAYDAKGARAGKLWQHAMRGTAAWVAFRKVTQRKPASCWGLP